MLPSTIRLHSCVLFSHLPAFPTRRSSDLIIINVMAPPGDYFQGDELLDALLQNGMRFGDMEIFHRHQEANGQGPILFSLRSEEHTSELQSRPHLVCRLLLE